MSAKTSEGARKKQRKTSQDKDSSVSVDLTNPEDVLKKLQQWDIDDSEADELLKKAYEINRELKKQLELGRIVMDKKLSVAKRTPISNHRRPGSNRTSASKNSPGDQYQTQTRMASASQSTKQRKHLTDDLHRPVKNYSYHSYVSTCIMNYKFSPACLIIILLTCILTISILKLCLTIFRCRNLLENLKVVAFDFPSILLCQ